jgi:hypothetical protein
MCTVVRAGGETETTQENIRDWFQVDGGHVEFQFLLFGELLNRGRTVII